jgi:hypothetical protein
MRESNVVAEPVRVRVTPPADVTSKDVAESLLDRLDQPRNRGGKRLQSNTSEGQLEVWRDAAGRVHMKHPRLRSDKGDEISVRLDRRGNFLKSSENIFTLKMFLEANPIALSYVKATVT